MGRFATLYGQKLSETELKLFGMLSGKEAGVLNQVFVEGLPTIKGDVERDLRFIGDGVVLRFESVYGMRFWDARRGVALSDKPIGLPNQGEELDTIIELNGGRYLIQTNYQGDKRHYILDGIDNPKLTPLNVITHYTNFSTKLRNSISGHQLVFINDNFIVGDDVVYRTPDGFRVFGSQITEHSNSVNRLMVVSRDTLMWTNIVGDKFFGVSNGQEFFFNVDKLVGDDDNLNFLSALPKNGGGLYITAITKDEKIVVASIGKGGRLNKPKVIEPPLADDEKIHFAIYNGKQLLYATIKGTNLNIYLQQGKKPPQRIYQGSIIPNTPNFFIADGKLYVLLGNGVLVGTPADDFSKLKKLTEDEILKLLGKDRKLDYMALLSLTPAQSSAFYNDLHIYDDYSMSDLGNKVAFITLAGIVIADKQTGNIKQFVLDKTPLMLYKGIIVALDDKNNPYFSHIIEPNNNLLVEPIKELC